MGFEYVLVERSGDFRLRDHARQTIGAKQNGIPGEERMLFGVHFNFRRIVFAGKIFR